MFDKLVYIPSILPINDPTKHDTPICGKANLKVIISVEYALSMKIYSDWYS